MSGTDPNGRWWAFKVTPKTLVILEKKTCPEHLQNLGCLDTCTPLQQVLREIQDSGEARLKSYLDANGREHGFKYATTLWCHCIIIIKYVATITIVFNIQREMANQLYHYYSLSYHSIIGTGIYVRVCHPKRLTIPLYHQIWVISDEFGTKTPCVDVIRVPPQTDLYILHQLRSGLVIVTSQGITLTVCQMTWSHITIYDYMMRP